jgi:hypothetical protein
MPALDDSRGSADGNGVIRDVGENNRVRADNRATSNANPRPDDDVLTEPCSIADLDGADTRNPLFENRSRPVVEGVHMVGDVDVAGEQDLLPEPNGMRRRKDAVSDDARPVSNRKRDPRTVAFEDLKPGASADENVAPDGNPTLPHQANRQLQHGLPAELSERSTDSEGESFVPRTGDCAIRGDRPSTHEASESIARRAHCGLILRVDGVRVSRCWSSSLR